MAVKEKKRSEAYRETLAEPIEASISKPTVLDSLDNLDKQQEILNPKTFDLVLLNGTTITFCEELSLGQIEKNKALMQIDKLIQLVSVECGELSGFENILSPEWAKYNAKYVRVVLCDERIYKEVARTLSLLSGEPMDLFLSQMNFPICFMRWGIITNIVAKWRENAEEKKALGATKLG